MAKTKSAVRVPGTWAIYRAPVGTTEPADSQEALDAAWTELGYTDEDGLVFTFGREIADIRVGQSYWPIRKVITEYAGSVRVTLAEYSKTNVEVALEATVTEPDSTGNPGEFLVTPATDGTLTEHALLLEIEDGTDVIRRVIRDCVVGNVGDQQVRKANKLGLNCTFDILGEDSLAPWIDLANLAALDPAP